MLKGFGYSRDCNFVRILVKMTKNFGPMGGWGVSDPHTPLGYSPAIKGYDVTALFDIFLETNNHQNPMRPRRPLAVVLVVTNGPLLFSSSQKAFQGLQYTTYYWRVEKSPQLVWPA